jgi:hypothetical protein
MHLSIFVDSEDEHLKRLYVESAQSHNAKLVEDPDFYDAGFDLFLPTNSVDSRFYGTGTRFFGYGWEDLHNPVNKVDFKVKCCAKLVSKEKIRYTPFYTYARSSISKTPLRLANNQGIIDAGYRGPLIGMFDCIYEDKSRNVDCDYCVDEYTRLLQICAPGLIPVYVCIVDRFEELGKATARGEGGFGSTGK